MNVLLTLFLFCFEQSASQQVLISQKISAGGPVISVDAVSNSTQQTTATTYTWSHTSAASTSMWCGVAIRGNGAARTITAFTYNGSTLAQIASSRNVVGFRSAEWWKINAPTTGANTVSITLSGAATSSAVGCITLLGASTTVDAVTGTSGTATSNSTSITTVANNAWILHTIGCGATAGLTITQGTAQWNLGTGDVEGGGTFGPVTPAGATSVGWSWTGSNGFVTSLISVAP